MWPSRTDFVSQCAASARRNILVIVAMSGCLLAPSAGAAAVGERPQTIPALQDWDGGTGTWRLRHQPLITTRCGDSALRGEARLLARDLAAVSRRAVEVADCGVRPRRGDVALARARRARLPKEGYRLRIGRALEVAAPQTAGVFYGGRTILQLIRGGEPIPRGRARDWPLYPERGLMVDVGRQYFTPRWIRAHIRELAWLKLNYLHLHLSDDLGFRIESRTHPEIVSADHLTKKAVRRILAVAERYHVTVVPEIDMPGHMGAALAQHPELQLRDALGNRQPTVLDVSDPAARRFARDLIEEYLDLFGGAYWHVGADEVFRSLGPLLYPRLEAYAESRYGARADADDAIHDFVNWVNRIVRRHGKTTRMWHDGVDADSVVTRATDIVVEWWFDGPTLSPRQLVDRGYRVMNAGWYPTYYVNGMGGTSTIDRPDVARAYEEWEVNRFLGKLGDDVVDLLAPGDPATLGAKLQVWNDNPGLVTQAETANAIADGLRMLAQKTWASPQLTPTYGEFRTVIEGLGHAPGYGAATRP